LKGGEGKKGVGGGGETEGERGGSGHLIVCLGKKKTVDDEAKGGKGCRGQGGFKGGNPFPGFGW